MDEEEPAGTKKVSRRDLLKLTAVTLAAVKGVQALSQIHLPDAQTEGLVTPYKGEVKPVSLEDEQKLDLELKNRIPALQASNMSTFQIHATGPEGGTASSFAVVSRVNGDPVGLTRMFVLQSNQVTELKYSGTQMSEELKEVTWYIPGDDVPEGEKGIPGALGMQEIVGYTLKNGLTDRLMYRPPENQEPALYGKSEDRYGVPVATDSLPFHTQTSLFEIVTS